jgi:hypothetical protein
MSDSRPATYQHIGQVRSLLLGAAGELMARAHRHDASKLVSPEVEVFDEVSAKLSTLTYGSDEYKASLREMGPALEHHYEVNDHHPEHFENGIREMNLLQVTEMLCDWIAASRRHSDGDIRRSIDFNADRFGYGREIRQLLHNTVTLLEELGLPVEPAVA